MKKKLLLILCALCCTLCLAVGFAACDNAPTEDFVYALNDDKESYSITGLGRDPDAALTVPAEYKGKPITAIRFGAFNAYTSIKSVTLPESVTRIGNSVFAGCTALESITLPSGLLHLGGSVFYGCTSLTGITIPDGVTGIESGTFYGCTALRSVTLPDGIAYIGEEAFRNCLSLTSMTVPESVTTIREFAFKNCSALTDIIFQGTKAQWEAIEKGTSWDLNSGDYAVHCTDGDIEKAEE